MSTPTTRANALLASHRDALETLIEANAAPYPRVTRLLLDGTTRQAIRYLRRIAHAEDEMRRAPDAFAGLILGEFGENGCAPAIRDICKRAEMHRTAAMTEARAA